MDERDLKKLKRSELLEIMLAQSKEIDRLKEQLEEEKQRTEEERQRSEEKDAALKEASEVAEKSLQLTMKLTRVFEDTIQKADTVMTSLQRKQIPQKK